MGQFSWYTCDTKTPIYDNKPANVYLLNPFGENYHETCYDGYGRFGGVDAYDKVAEWNKDYLMKLYENTPDDNHLKQIAKIWIEKGEEAVVPFINEQGFASYLTRDWKRNIGIDIACYDKENFTIPYPIKIARRDMAYEDALPSISDRNQGWHSSQLDIQLTRNEIPELADMYYESRELYFKESEAEFDDYDDYDER